MTEQSREYGEGLYALCAEEALSGDVLEELDVLNDSFKAQPDYLRLLSNMSLGREERLGILDKTLRGQVHPYVLNFMKILCEAGAIRLLPGCLRSYERRYDQDHNILKARAVTAVEMTQEQQEALRQKLSAVTGKTIRLTCRTDPDCLGGVRVEMDGQRLDGTVRRHLEDMNDLLSKAVF